MNIGGLLQQPFLFDRVLKASRSADQYIKTRVENVDSVGFSYPLNHAAARIAASSRARSTPCSRTDDNLTLQGRRSLHKLLQANHRLNVAYLHKESFGQLWDYRREAWARRFFENWKAALKWQRLKPYEKFAAMIDRHWDGIAAYCRPENKVSLGFVEGLNNKIRVLQRRAYGLRDEQYLRLKILTCMLPEI